MAKERLYLFDTTMRDGAQTLGVDFSVEDKRRIAIALDELGVDYVEAGWPGANPTDSKFFEEPPVLKNALLTAFGMTRRPGRSASNDPGLQAVLQSRARVACIVGKAWNYQVETALGIEASENIDLIADTIQEAKQKKEQAIYDAEHFFDGYKANPQYALDCVKAAYQAGARWVVLCDTNGGSMPNEVERITAAVAQIIPHVGIHTHNDTEQAVANSLAAVRGGARHVQGTINGLGERCGNANLISLIPSLTLKSWYSDRFEIGVSAEGLTRLVNVSRLLDEILNQAPHRHQAYVGAAAFAHKGGLHVSAVLKDPSTYEHVSPESVGNQRHILVSSQSGRSNILARLKDVNIELDPNDYRVDALLVMVKQRADFGWTYDGAEASFEMLARRALKQVPDYFRVESFKVEVETRHNAKNELISVSQAVVKVDVDGERLMSVAEGNGPVHALDQALRKDLGKYQSYLSDLRLADFKVRILDSGTEAITRVVIESIDGAGSRWFTVGVSANIVEASFMALHDSIIYKLFKASAPTRGVAKIRD